MLFSRYVLCILAKNKYISKLDRAHKGSLLCSLNEKIECLIFSHNDVAMVRISNHFEVSAHGLKRGNEATDSVVVGTGDYA